MPPSPKGRPDQRQRMLETPIPQLVSSMAVPTIISMLVTSIYNMADTYFVSQIGTSASGAVGVVFSVMALIQAVGFTVGMGSGWTAGTSVCMLWVAEASGSSVTVGSAWALPGFSWDSSPEASGGWMVSLSAGGSCCWILSGMETCAPPATDWPGASPASLNTSTR